MPVKRSSDSNGPFYRWGKTGKKYYYRAGEVAGRAAAHAAASAQGAAIKGGSDNPYIDAIKAWGYKKLRGGSSDFLFTKPLNNVPLHPLIKQHLGPSQKFQA